MLKEWEALKKSVERKQIKEIREKKRRLWRVLLRCLLFQNEQKSSRFYQFSDNEPYKCF